MIDVLPPQFLEPIAPQVINEGANYGPLDLNKFIASSNVESGKVHFSAELSDGLPLPKGLICTTDGFITGIPAKGTFGTYEFVITAKNASDEPLMISFPFIIKPRVVLEEDSVLSNFKSKVWEAVGLDLPLPDLSAILDRPITPADIFYLLQRFATLIIWDVYNLDPPGEKHLLQLEGTSPHYNIYDRGSCLVATPKDLYTYERTLFDALQTARVMAREVYQRQWTIEFAGFSKMARASWVELQLLADQYGKSLEVLHYTPSESDQKLYEIESTALRRSPRTM